MNYNTGSGMFRQAIPPRNPNDVRGYQMMQGRAQAKNMQSHRTQQQLYSRQFQPQQGYSNQVYNSQLQSASVPDNYVKQNLNKGAFTPEETQAELDKLMSLVSEKESKLAEYAQYQARQQAKVEIQQLRKKKSKRLRVDRLR